MSGTLGTDTRHVQRLPLAAGAEHEKDGIHGFAIIDTGPMAPQRVWFAWGQQGQDALP
jgi:hypothetical protein